MKVYEYKDYDEYLYYQEFANKRKIGWVYVREAVIQAIFSIMGKEVSNILCHGTRNGTEQQFFKKYYPEAYIIGTEISSTATEFPMTIQHDFSKPIAEWEGKFDIVYSNSFDHTICPEQTVEVWGNQLNSRGRLFLEFSEQQSVGSDVDPLWATAKEVKDLINSKLNCIGEIKGLAKHGGIVFIAERKND